MRCRKEFFGVVGVVLLVVGLLGLGLRVSVVEGGDYDYEPDFLVTDPHFWHYSAWEPVWSIAGAVGWDTEDAKGLTYFWNDSFGGWYESKQLIDCEGWYGWVNNSYRNRWYPAFVPPNVAEHGNSILFQGQFPHSNEVLGTWTDFWIDYPCPEDTLILEFTVENIDDEPRGIGVVDGLPTTTTPFVSVGPDVFWDLEPDYDHAVYGWFFDYDSNNAAFPIDVVMQDFFPIHFWDTTGSPNGAWPGFEPSVYESYSWTQGDLVCGICNPYVGYGAYDEDWHWTEIVDVLEYGNETTYRVDLGAVFNQHIQTLHDFLLYDIQFAFSYWPDGGYIKGVACTMETVSAEYEGRIKYLQLYWCNSSFMGMTLDSIAEEPNPSYELSEDVNEDGGVDMLDVSIVIDACFTEPGDSEWNPDADVNSDCEVDMLDVSLVYDNCWEYTGWANVGASWVNVDWGEVVEDTDFDVWLRCDWGYAFHTFWFEGSVDFERTNSSGSFTDYYDFHRVRYYSIESDAWVFEYENPNTILITDVRDGYLEVRYEYNYTS